MPVTGSQTRPRRVPDARLPEQLRQIEIGAGASPRPSAGPMERADEALSPLDTLKGAVVDLFARDGWTPCHAASAEIDGRLVVIPAASGGGKSTLSVLLALRGHAVADELAFLREVRRGVEALVPPLPLSVLEETLRRLPRAASWRFGPPEIPKGKALLRPPALLAGAGRVAAIVLLPRGGPGGETSLRHAPRHEAARALLENIVRYTAGGPAYAGPRRRAWRVFCALLDRVPTYALRGDLLRDGEAAAGLVEDAMRGGRQCLAAARA